MKKRYCYEIEMIKKILKEELERELKVAEKNEDFEKCIIIRDKLIEIKLKNEITNKF